MCLTHISRQLILNEKAQRNEGNEKMPEKQYINKCKVKEEVFTYQGNQIKVLKVGLNMEELQKFEKNGYVNVTISKRREVGKYGDTHSMYLNEYEPKKEDTPF